MPKPIKRKPVVDMAKLEALYASLHQVTADAWEVARTLSTLAEKLAELMPVKDYGDDIPF